MIEAAGLGFEPRLTGPEPAVLPLDDPARTTRSIDDGPSRVLLRGRFGPVVVARAAPPAHGHQLVVSASLGASPVLEHHDQVGAADGREPVGAHEGRATGEQARERLLDYGL